MGLFDKVKTDISSFDWNQKIGRPTSKRNKTDNLPESQVKNKPLEDQDIDGQYDFRGGMKAALRGENNLGFDQPFVVRDIGDSYPSFRDGIFRGGLPLQIVRAAEDVTRISKFLLTPNGVLWGLKQALLQNMNAREETRKFNVIKDLASIAPTIHTERHADTFGPSSIPQTKEELVALGAGFQSKGYLDVKRDSDGKDGLGEVISNSTPIPQRETPTIGDQIASAFGFGGGGPQSKDASAFDLGNGKIKTSGETTLYANTISNMLQVPYGGKFGKLDYAVGTPENIETLLGNMGVTTAVNCYPGISSSKCYPEAYFFVDYLDDVMEKIEKHIKTCSETNTVIIVGTKTHMYWHDILNKKGKMKKWFVDAARDFNKWTGKTMYIYSFEFGMMKP